jgi:hypothetical protein
MKHALQGLLPHNTTYDVNKKRTGVNFPRTHSTIRTDARKKEGVRDATLGTDYCLGTQKGAETGGSSEIG